MEVTLTEENYYFLEAMAPDHEVSQTLNDLVNWYREECTEEMPIDA